MKFGAPGQSHPRLFVGNGTFPKLETLPVSAKPVAERIIYDARLLLSKPVQPREMIGRRLLAASREVLARITTLGMARMLTGDAEFSRRAREELLSAAAYFDWNPSHFLDTAEMTMAVAIGYDWFYAELSGEDRRKLSEAILNKGLHASFAEPMWWITGDNNWNQVCHAGMVAGALAIYEDAPELAQRTIARAVENVPRSMQVSYYPNGAYPEGPMYWGYGTDFNVVLLALLDAAYGEDFGLSSQPGFERTGEFMSAAIAPSGKPFAYADCSMRYEISLALLWLTGRFHRPDYFKEADRRSLERYAAKRPQAFSEADAWRLFPLALLYWNVPEQTVKPPQSYYSGDEAAVPITVHRAGHGPESLYLGIKGGSPSSNHGHMDAGAFVFESSGVRWCSDLGMEDYERIESRNLPLWEGKQHGGRWKIFRLSADAHSILRIDGADQLVEGRATFLSFSPLQSELDLSSLYKAGKITRRFTIRPDRSLEICDSLSGVRPGASVSFQLCTECEAEAAGPGTIRLKANGKTLAIHCEKARWRITPAEQLMHECDSPNPGARLLVFEQTVPESGELEYTVHFAAE